MKDGLYVATKEGKENLIKIEGEYWSMVGYFREDGKLIKGGTFTTHLVSRLGNKVSLKPYEGKA